MKGEGEVKVGHCLEDGTSGMVLAETELLVRTVRKVIIALNTTPSVLMDDT